MKSFNIPMAQSATTDRNTVSASETYAMFELLHSKFDEPRDEKGNCIPSTHTQESLISLATEIAKVFDQKFGSLNPTKIKTLHKLGTSYVWQFPIRGYAVSLNTVLRESERRPLNVNLSVWIDHKKTNLMLEDPDSKTSLTVKHWLNRSRDLLGMATEITNILCH